MGRDKLLLPWGETVVLGSVLDALDGGGCHPVVVVVSPSNVVLREWLSTRGRTTAINPDPERGMLSTILAGIEALGGAGVLQSTTDGLLVCPGDHAGLAPSTVAAVRGALVGAAPPPVRVLAVPVVDGRRGHPLGIASGLLREVPGLDPSIGLRQLMSRHATDVVEIPVADRAAVRDLDTPQDYRRSMDP